MTLSLYQKKNWNTLNTSIKIESIREFKNPDRVAEHATRYYISSLIGKAEDFQKAIRSHWTIENKSHWMLDVAFYEDDSRKRKENSTQNFSILLKIALNILKNTLEQRLVLKVEGLKPLGVTTTY